jgi:hypothetical protein
MEIEDDASEMTEYRLVLVQPVSHTVLILDAKGRGWLPRVRIPRRTRSAEQLGRAIKAVWGVDVFLLDFLTSQGTFSTLAIAELIGPNTSNTLTPVELDSIPMEEIPGPERDHLADVLAGRTGSPFSRIGWIEEAVAWLESTTQKRLLSKSSIHQLNAGGSFALVRFQTEDSQPYWLKAAGQPNTHEMSLTLLLSELCGDYLPTVISSKPSWNAWLASEEATRIAELPTDPGKLCPLLESAVISMAHLQIRTAGHHLELLDAGAFDQGIPHLQERSEAVFDYLEEAMALQTPTKALPISGTRLQEIRMIFEDVCGRVERLRLPQTIVHGDLNCGNILHRPRGCQFIDWPEAYVGNPLISLEHLLRLNHVDDLKERSSVLRRVLGVYASCNSFLFAARAW